MHRRILSEIYSVKKSISDRISIRTLISGGGVEVDDGDPLYTDVPRPLRKKSQRKPYQTPMKVLVQRAKQEREARKANPCRRLEESPDNGLLVPELIEVAHRVFRAKESLLLGISKLLHFVPVLRCRHCFEVHIGKTGHEIRTCTGPNSGFRSSKHEWRKGRASDVIYFPKCFHLHDRVLKPRVIHDERRATKRIPAILELCIQAGLNIEKYPTKRRTKPVYNIEGRIVDFEPETNNEEDNSFEKVESLIGTIDSNEEEDDQEVISVSTLASWNEMLLGTKKLMEKYKVHTCGYCPEVQVGPKGHKVRMCKSSKHQSRDGLHAWQEATMDDLVVPNYVWHVVNHRDVRPLDNNLKRFYGKAPAAVELCVQNGAPIPEEYRSMMRVDVVRPGRDEVDLVA
ncbi:APO protein 3, mitochondrial [Impatiens glandulifera]|uniref:APO protein 3, mitochondrial n=1 Tax=Impatiens glandulifera TaxID=253017 RepID=UPI001FB15398|nr:APO protein 3, mitochondrial [Impatiens glandulifera]